MQSEEFSYQSLSNKSHTTDPEKKRTIRIDIRVNQDEYDELQKQYKKTTFTFLAHYLRSVVFNRRIIVKTRNQSLDDFLADMIGLRKELDEIVDEFSRSIRVLGNLQTASEIQHWILQNEQDKTRILRQIEKINNRINEIYQQCFQK